MRWSIPLIRIFGIPIKVHFSFFLLLAYVYYEYSVRETSSAGIAAVITICALFACVVAHELGHSLAALAFGTKTRGIILLPIGGVALLEQIPREAHKEILIAIAGPLVSVALSFFFLILSFSLGYNLNDIFMFDLTVEKIPCSLFLINLILVIVHRISQN